jgi:hypothetical protein
MRTSMPRWIVPIALLALGSGCRSVPMPEPEPIPIYDNLSEQAIEVAVLSALTAQPPPGSYDPRVEMSGQDFEQLTWNYYVASPGRAWVIESREPRRVVGVIERASFRLRVQVTWDDHRARASILDSTGLGQQDDQIHHHAVGWLRKLERRLRAELSRLAAN